MRYGVRYSSMGAWEGLMSERDMWKVATFLTASTRCRPQSIRPGARGRRSDDKSRRILGKTPGIIRRGSSVVGAGNGS